MLLLLFALQPPAGVTGLSAARKSAVPSEPRSAAIPAISRKVAIIAVRRVAVPS
jgi:hypothetical protein